MALMHMKNALMKQRLSFHFLENHEINFVKTFWRFSLLLKTLQVPKSTETFGRFLLILTNSLFESLNFFFLGCSSCRVFIFVAFDFTPFPNIFRGRSRSRWRFINIYLLRSRSESSFTNTSSERSSFSSPSDGILLAADWFSQYRISSQLGFLVFFFCRSFSSSYPILGDFSSPTVSIGPLPWVFSKFFFEVFTTTAASTTTTQWIIDRRLFSYNISIFTSKEISFRYSCCASNTVCNICCTFCNRLFDCRFL